MNSSNATTIKVPSVLFVCTANLIRSPLAEVLFRYQLRQTEPDWRNWLIESAGTWAATDKPAILEAQQVAEKRGVSLNGHRSRMVTKEILSQFNLILTMEPGQKEALQLEFPFAANRIFTLSEMSGELIAIDDPVGGTVDDVEQAASDIDYWITAGWEKILELAKKNPGNTN